MSSPTRPYTHEACEVVLLLLRRAHDGRSHFFRHLSFRLDSDVRLLVERRALLQKPFEPRLQGLSGKGCAIFTLHERTLVGSGLQAPRKFLGRGFQVDDEPVLSCPFEVALVDECPAAEGHHDRFALRAAPEGFRFHPAKGCLPLLFEDLGDASSGMFFDRRVQIHKVVAELLSHERTHGALATGHEAGEIDFRPSVFDF